MTGAKFTLFAKVVDPDGDLKKYSVYTTVTAFYGIGGYRETPQQMYDDGKHAGDQVANDSIFTFTADWLVPTNLTWDGSVVLFNATDMAGHQTTARMTLSVVAGPSGGGNENNGDYNGTWNSTLGGIGQGDSGPEGDYGYNIYNKAGLPNNNSPGGTPTRIFIQGETVYVIARSTVVRNLQNINTFILRDSTGYKLYPPTKEYDSRDPTKNQPAFAQTKTNPYYEYRYSFNTSSLAYASYPLEFTLKDNAGHAPFFATDRIWVSQTGSPGQYPRIVTYKDPNGDGVLSDLVPATTFKSIEKMYIRIYFKDLDGDTASCSPWFVAPMLNTCSAYVNANAGNFEIRDYFGATQVKKIPGTSPVSLISRYAYDTGSDHSYIVYIDLLHHDQDPWVPGTNYYAFKIYSISDSGYGGTTAESYQTLSTQVVVVAPMSTIDVITATQGSGGAKGRGVYWYENQFYWREHTVDNLPNDAKKPTALATGDLNGDTKVDIVVATDADNVANIVIYYNLDYGTTWRRDFVNQIQKKADYKAQSLAVGDLTGDGNAEIVAGVKDFKGGDAIGVVVFWNDGNWTPQLLRYSEGGKVPEFVSLAIGDINNDGRPDIVAGDKNGVVDWFCNNVRGSWLPPKTNACPGQSSLQPGGATESISQGVKVGKAGGLQGDQEIAIGKMEGISGDLDPTNPSRDNTLDIVVTNNKDLIIYRTSLSGNVPSWTKYDVNSAGDNIPNNIQSIAVGDMNADRKLDILVGIDPAKEDSGVFRFRNMGMTGPNFNQWTDKKLAHSIIDPSTGKPADLGKVIGMGLGDTDGDGDLDIVYCTENDHDFLNNVWQLENRNDDTPFYVETNIFTDNWFTKKEHVFGIAMGYINL